MEWQTRWGYEIAKKRSAPGIWPVRQGGYLYVVRVGPAKKREWVQEYLPKATLTETKAAREGARVAARLSKHPTATLPRTLWSVFAASLFEHKVEAGDLKSNKTVERWSTTLRLHLVPAFGHLSCEEIRFAHLEAWREGVAKRIGKNKLAPTTANGWISILKVVCSNMAAKMERADPSLKLAYFDTSRHPTYTREWSNSLPPDKVHEFCDVMKWRYPSQYAFTRLGFATGLRPAELRGLRRDDLDWSTGELRVRHSHSKGETDMDGTKTENERVLYLSAQLVVVLAVHVGELRGKAKASPLMFPGRDGSFSARSSRDKPFKRVSQLVGINPPVTPYAMRRTNKDLSRAAGVDRIVRKKISGHVTDEMDEHYSTASPDEIRDAISRVDAFLAGNKAGKERADAS